MKKLVLLLWLACTAFDFAAAQTATPSLGNMITIGGVNYYVHNVVQGDTFYSLSKRYGVDEATIRENNPHLAEGLKTGLIIKIPVVRAESRPLSERKMSRLFDVHVVNQGETAYSISRRYGISLQTLIEDNPGFDPAHLSIGQKINIRIKSQGQTHPEQIREEIAQYTENLNSVSTHFTHHAVKQGETLYSLSRSLNIPVDTLTKYNAEELKDGLKMGSILRIPVKDTVTVATAGLETTGTAPVATPGGGETLPVGGSETVTRPNDLWSTSGSFRYKNIDQTAPLRVAVLLPLQVDASANPQFLEFYQGFLLALGELKSIGVSAQVDVFNTGRSEAEVKNVLRDPALRQADLILGPVYDDCFAPAARFAETNGIPIVSPLGSIDGIETPAAFQVFPVNTTKSEKLREDLTPDKNVIVISAASVDQELRDETASLVPPSAHRLNHSAHLASDVEKLLSGDKENVILVLANSEIATDEILARISSVQNNLMARSIKSPVIKVIGSAKWARYQNVDKSLYFKLNVRYITSYHADRGNARVVDFDRRYVSEFGSLPSQYSYRGYDVGKLFVGSLKLHGAQFVPYLNDDELPLLQVPYRFGQVSPSGKFVNQEWAKVCYNRNYTIEVR